ncbi:TPA: AAA family ATPase [Streptococcus suis]
MKLTKVIINNFRSFGDSQVIGFNDQTVLIGNNSSGKTTVLQALSKLFSDKQNDRIIRKSDFHLPKGLRPGENSRTLFIETIFEFDELDGTAYSPAIPSFFEHFTVSQGDAKTFLRIRLESSWEDDGTVEGSIDTQIYYISSAEDIIKDEDKHRAPRKDLDKIRVLYVPASRTPEKELGNASGSMLSRLVNSINWTDDEIKEITNKIDELNNTYLIISFSVAILICLLVAFVFKRVRYDTVKQLYHRQKLAKMILENKWYESEQVKTEGFFKDSAGRTKEKITYFPKMYYRLKNGLIQIRVEITLGKYQDQLLHLEKKLESGLYCELMDKELKDSYVEYTLLYDTIASRISIDEVEAKDGKLRLMKNVWWEYDKLPHMLIAGGTGGGKTYFILTLIEALLHTDSKLYILDPKNADLADLGSVMANVYYRKEDLLSCIETFYEEMMKRSEEMKQMKNYKTGKNYAYLGLPAHFLIFDEYVAFMEMLGTKENTAVMNKLKQIVMLGRQAGFFLILACQRPDAKYLGDGIRDQFNFRVALGRMSEMGYGMMFGSDVQKDFFLKRIKGRGYVDVGTSVISEFYTPLVPKGYDFLEEIKKLSNSRQSTQATCEAEVAGVD